MLLCELVDLNFSDDFNMSEKHLALKAQTVKISHDMPPEEAKQFAAMGIDPSSIGDVSVVYGYAMPLIGKRGTPDEKARDAARRDALKMRGRYAGKSIGPLVTDAVARVVQRLVKNPKLDDAVQAVGRAGAQLPPGTIYSRKEVQQLAPVVRVFKSSSPKVIVQMPSSSPLNSMISKALQSQIGGTIIDAQITKVDPHLSREYLKKWNYNPEGVADIRQAKEKLEELELNIETHPDPSSAEYKALVAERDALRNKLQQSKSFQIKNMMSSPQSAHGRAYYGWIKAKDDFKVPKEADVIIVDDNIVTGATVAQAVKELIRKGIDPQRIVGFALHKF